MPYGITYCYVRQKNIPVGFCRFAKNMWEFQREILRVCSVFTLTFNQCAKWNLVDVNMMCLVRTF